jgi:WD40 repeat protein
MQKVQDEKDEKAELERKEKLMHSIQDIGDLSSPAKLRRDIGKHIQNIYNRPKAGDPDSPLKKGIRPRKRDKAWNEKKYQERGQIILPQPSYDEFHTRDRMTHWIATWGETFVEQELVPSISSSVELSVDTVETPLKKQKFDLPDLNRPSILTADDDGTMKQWDLSLNLMNTFPGAGEGPIWTMACSLCKRFFVTGDDNGNIQVWDLLYAKLIYEFPKAHTYAVLQVEFAKGEKHKDALFSVGKRGYLKQWSIRDKCMTKNYGIAHNQAALALISTHDGEYVFSAGQYGFVKQWSVEGQCLYRDFGRIHE